MVKFLSWYKKVTDVLAEILVTFGAIGVAVTASLVFLESVTRYLVGHSRGYMEEFPRLLIPFVVFLAMGALFKLDRHLDVKILKEKLTGKSKNILNIVVGATVLGLSLTLTVAGMGTILHLKHTGIMSVTELPFPIWWAKSCVPIGFGLLSFFSLESVLRNAHDLYISLKEDFSAKNLKGTKS